MNVRRKSVRGVCPLFGELHGVRSVLAVSLAVLPGCAQKLRPIFDDHRPLMVWPQVPAPARVRYVGQLRSSADLKPARKAFQALGELLVGAPEPSPLYGPRAAVRTADGRRLWVADPGGRCLHLFDLAERTYTKITRAGNAQLLSPVHVSLGPGDSIYVCDSEAVAIHRLASMTGKLLETLRISEDIARPAAVSYNHARRELFVADVSAHNVKVLARDGSLLRIIGRRGEAPGEFNFPSCIADDGEMIWVVDTGNHRVQGLTHSGEPKVSFGQAGDAPGDLALPKGIAVDSAGNLYVVDARFENVQVFDRSGRLLLFFGEEGTGPGAFWLPAGITIDSEDRIWVCDSYNRRVQVFDLVKERPTPGSGEP